MAASNLINSRHARRYAFASRLLHTVLAFLLRCQGQLLLARLMRAWLGWGAGLAAAVLSAELAKDQGLRTSNWETWPLSLEQQQYAALDAYASLLLYQVAPPECLSPYSILISNAFLPTPSDHSWASL